MLRGQGSRTKATNIGPPKNNDYSTVFGICKGQELQAVIKMVRLMGLLHTSVRTMDPKSKSLVNPKLTPSKPNVNPKYTQLFKK